MYVFVRIIVYNTIRAFLAVRTLYYYYYFFFIKLTTPIIGLWTEIVTRVTNYNTHTGGVLVWILDIALIILKGQFKI